MPGEAIILAGGLGTRLRTVVADLPKCMAEVAGKPFLFHVIKELQAKEIDSFIFSLGYKHELIVTYLQEEFPKLDFKLSIEDEPLGTGGAIKLACKKAAGDNVLVVNGDTLFKVNIPKLLLFHSSCRADCTLTLKPMHNFDRYGVVELNADYSIRDFKEKQYYDSGLINGGVYAINTIEFLKEQLPEKFSFEKDYLEQYFGKRRMYGVEEDVYFIDIGIPEDFARANAELK